MVKLTDESPMPFGKHKGTPLQDVPASYLLWLYEKMLDDENQNLMVFRYLHENAKALRDEVESGES